MLPPLPSEHDRGNGGDRRKDRQTSHRQRNTPSRYDSSLECFLFRVFDDLRARPQEMLKELRIASLQRRSEEI
jgi:hypothetical protein